MNSYNQAIKAIHRTKTHPHWRRGEIKRISDEGTWAANDLYKGLSECQILIGTAISNLTIMDFEDPIEVHSKMWNACADNLYAIRDALRTAIINGNSVLKQG